MARILAPAVVIFGGIYFHLNLYMHVNIYVYIHVEYMHLFYVCRHESVLHI